MFTGHYGAALVAATARKAPTLGVLFVGAQLVDIAFFAFVLADIEHMRVTPGITAMNPMELYDMPWTHSLLGASGWALAFALIVGGVARSRAAAAIAALVVLSHWLLDMIVHRADLTLWGMPPPFGLGLWNRPMIEMPLELAIGLGALLFYMRRTRAVRRGGMATLIALAAVMVGFQAIDWFAPPPAEMSKALPVTALAAYAIMTALAFAAGMTREIRPRVLDLATR